MEVDKALELLKRAVKNNGTNDTRHIDLTLVPNDERPLYEKALIVVKLAIQEGKISLDEVSARIHL